MMCLFKRNCYRYKLFLTCLFSHWFAHFYLFPYNIICTFSIIHFHPDWSHSAKPFCMQKIISVILKIYCPLLHILFCYYGVFITSYISEPALSYPKVIKLFLSKHIWFQLSSLLSLYNPKELM